jgi:hypothetical protein
VEESKEDQLERIKQLTNNKDHVRTQALGLAGQYLRGLRDEIVEQELSKIDEEDGEIWEACCKQLEAIGREIENLGVELDQQSKDMPNQGLGSTYLLNSTSKSTHRVVIDDDQAVLSQILTFPLISDDIEMLIAVLQGVKADKSVPHSFSNVSATYNYFYEPAGGANSFIVKHMASGHTIGMELRVALNLLKALTGKTEHLIKIGKGGPPLVPQEEKTPQKLEFEECE